MDLLWVTVSGILILAGIAGSLLPLLPGPPLSYLGLLVLQLRDNAPFTTKFLVGWAAIVLVIMVLDYAIPILGTKKFGGTKFGLWGCTFGLIAGFWFGPIGIIAGPFLGALLGEWLGNRNSNLALKAAMGSFIGFLVGTVMKIVACVIMLYYFIATL